MSALEGTACGGLATLSKICAQHALGISNTMEIIEAADLTSIPDPGVGTHTISTDIVVDSTKQWYQWRLGETNSEFTYQAVGQKGNQTFRNTLTVFVPLQRDAGEAVFNAMINGEFVIRFKDRDGKARVLGTAANPAMIPEGGIQGAVSDEQNGTTITFENVGHTPYFYTGAASLDPAA